jgi:hypothetical protein
MFKALFFSIWLFFHPVHVTLTSIDYIQEMDHFKVFVRMYLDDFMLDCKLDGIVIQNKDFSDNNSVIKEIIEQYLGGKIYIEVNKKLLSGQIENMNIADNEISLNLIYNSDKKPKTIRVKNLIMTGLYNDQANMIIVKINDFEQGVKLTSEATEQTFQIK